jgi:cytidylate kinase
MGSLRTTVITIDGPAASGKTVAGRTLAERLGFLFVSSGHYYRALSWAADHDQIDIKEPFILQHWLERVSLEPQFIQGELHLFIAGSDLTPHLNDPVVTSLVSSLASIPAVRDFLLKKLRSLADDHDLVMEGRDIGSVVFPETPWKIYIDAAPEERARRRAREGVIDNITERDRQDSMRPVAPLVIPEGAVVIDTTNLNLLTTHWMVENIVQQFQQRGLKIENKAP